MTVTIVQDYAVLLADIKKLVVNAQYAALKAVNKELISLYWDIGRTIVERQQNEPWGKAVVENLAMDLRKEFPGIGGFSASNLWRMRLFYEAYVSDEKLAPLVREISWSKNVVVFEKCKDGLEREFYIRMVRRHGWTKSVLINHIENQAYHKTLLNQTNFERTLPEELQPQALLAVKDEYTFGFLEMGEEHSERQLEQALTANMDRLLVEMGGMLSFVGRQYRLEISGREYFIDILLYHRRLRCLVALELKIGEFLPEYVGKMQFYLAALDDTTRLSDENPSIGIIICKEKDKTIVEYALRESNKPIGVATYRILESVPEELRDTLPTPEQIGRLLEVL